MRDMHGWVHCPLCLFNADVRGSSFSICRKFCKDKQTSNDLNIQFVARPRLGKLAIIPSTQKCSSAANQSLFDISFAVKGPKLWNAMPCHLNVIQDLERFKDQLTKFMLSLPDMLPIRGYTEKQVRSGVVESDGPVKS